MEDGKKTAALIGIAVTLVLVIGVAAAVLMRRAAPHEGEGATVPTGQQPVGGFAGQTVPVGSAAEDAFVDVPSPASAEDGDRDGLSNTEEQTLGTDPAKADTDGDGLYDGDEANYLKTDPKAPNAAPAR